VINSRLNLFKNCQIFLNFFTALFFLGEEDNDYLNTLLSFFINSVSLFSFYHGRSTIGAYRHAVGPRKLMFLSEGLYFLKHFFSCSMFGKWTANEKLFHKDLSRTVSHEHHEMCIVSKICSFAHSEMKFPLRFAAKIICFRISTEGPWMPQLMVLVAKYP